MSHTIIKNFPQADVLYVQFKGRNALDDLISAWKEVFQQYAHIKLPLLIIFDKQDCVLDLKSTDLEPLITMFQNHQQKTVCCKLALIVKKRELSSAILVAILRLKFKLFFESIKEFACLDDAMKWMRSSE